MAEVCVAVDLSGAGRSGAGAVGGAADAAVALERRKREGGAALVFLHGGPQIFSKLQTSPLRAVSCKSVTAARRGATLLEEIRLLQCYCSSTIISAI